MTEFFTIDSRYDELKIAAVVVRPEGEPRAVLQVAHGMCGNKERYMPFMEFMAMNGIACVANDHRGHGESVRSDRDLGYMYDGGAEALLDDMRLVTARAMEIFPGVPLFLLGHSMGSLAARAYVRRDDGKIDGLIICGSPAYNPLAPAAGKITGCLCSCGLGHMRPRIIQGIVSEGYNRNFIAEGPQSWTCSDPEVRKSFMGNPKNNFRFTANGTKCLMELMRQAYNRKNWAVKCPDMPIVFLSGKDDPCTGGASGLKKAADVLKNAGYRNLRGKTYPAMRHEILNELAKESVWQDILEFICRP